MKVWWRRKLELNSSKNQPLKVDLVSKNTSPAAASKANALCCCWRLFSPWLLASSEEEDLIHFSPFKLIMLSQWGLQVPLGRNLQHRALPEKDLDQLSAYQRGWAGVPSMGTPAWRKRSSLLTTKVCCYGKPTKGLERSKTLSAVWERMVWDIKIQIILHPRDHHLISNPGDLWLCLLQNSTLLISCWQGSSGPRPSALNYHRNWRRAVMCMWIASQGKTWSAPNTPFHIQQQSPRWLCSIF